MQKIEIEIIHDVVCSWCPIGYNNLKQALLNLQGEVEASIRFLPYELNPDMPEEGEEIVAHLIRRNGWSTAQVLSYRKNLIETAADAGLGFDFTKRTHYYNTFVAHCLIHWAEKFGKQSELNEVLIKAYFTDGLDMGDLKTLLALCDQVGLDSVAAKQALMSGNLAEELEVKQARVNALMIKSVPTFLFNGENIASGFCSVEMFERYLRSVINKDLLVNKKTS
ncbi:MAG: DsbA family oxidoreductase [Oceanospirillaceae bacterium]